jgi:hypothetical protein
MTDEVKVACPVCNQEMEKGYLVGYAGLKWTPDEKAGKHIVTNINTDLLYPDNEGAILENPRYLADRCRECMILVVRYRE